MPASPAADTHIAPNAAPAAAEVFAHWLRCCAADPVAPLTAAAAQPYQVIWNTWLRHLAAGGLGWQQADAVTVLHFIRTGPQSPRRHEVSPITRRRYWRILDRIYDHALLHGWVAANPAQGIARHELPPSEDPQGAILWPAMWRALQAQLPAAGDLIPTRDRCTLMLLMELALTPQEVRYLTVHDLEADAAGRITTVRIQGERARQSRSLPISPALAAALAQWLALRNAYHAMQAQETLLCSRKAPMLSSHSLLHIVSKTLRQAAQRHHLPEPARLGPQIIRNTVLVHWLENGCTVPEVLERAGLKNPEALQHLKAYWGA